MREPDPGAYAAGLLRGAFGDPRAAVQAAARAAAPHGSVVQLVRPEAVAGARHVASAVAHARRSFAEGRNRADRLELEVLCFLTGQRQIREALLRGGLTADAQEAVAVALDGDPRAALASVAEALAASLSWTLPGADAGEELPALERVALLDVER